MANQITVFLDPAQMPARTQDQTTFDNLMAALVANLPTFGAQVNAAAAGMNAAAAGTAYAIPYTFDATTTTDADPGAGKIRFDNATQSSTTTLRLDLLGSNGVDYTTLIDTFDASTSVIKGAVRIEKAADPTKFIAFNVTGRAAPTGYRNIAVSYVGISSANPFVNGDALILKFQRTGDKGDPATLTQVMHLRDEKTSGTAGGTSTAGFQTRTINTTKKNAITGASLASNQFTLPAGTYRLNGSAPAAGSGGHMLALYSVTDAAYTAYGTSEYVSSSLANVNTRSRIDIELVISASKTYELRHYISSGTGSNGLGVPVGAAGVNETYTEVFIEKVA